MNKQKLVEEVNERLELGSKAEAERVVKTIVDIICEGAIAEGECVIPGLGKLQVVATAPRPEKSGTINGVDYVTAAKPAGKKFKLNVLKDGKSRL